MPNSGETKSISDIKVTIGYNKLLLTERKRR